MQAPPLKYFKRGMTNVELLAIMACLCLLAAIILPGLVKPSTRAPVTVCVNNLKQLALAQLNWADDHSAGSATTNFPAANSEFQMNLTAANLTTLYRSLSNELVNPRILTCPADKRGTSESFETLDTNSISYFLNIDASISGNPEAALNGDRHLQSTPPRRTPFLTLRTNLDLGWDPTLLHKTIGNLSFVDGSVMKSSKREIKDYLGSPRTDGHRLLFP